MRWWLSFADDKGAIGVSIVEARDFGHAILRSTCLGLNLGGEIAAHVIPPAVLADDPVLNSLVDRILTKDELDVVAIQKGDPSYDDARRQFLENSDLVCEHCNNGTCNCQH